MTSATVPPPETRSWEDRAEMQDRSSASVGASRRPSRQSKSAFPGTMRQASAFADAGDVPRSAQADRWPKAFTPIEIGLPRRLRAERRPPPTQATLLGRRRPTVGRRPSRRLKSASPGACAPSVGLRRRKERFSVGAGRPLAEGLRRPNSFGAPRAERRPPPTQRMPFRSAQADRRPKASPGRIHSTLKADRWPKASSGRIHSTHRPTVGRRPPKVEFIRRARAPLLPYGTGS